MAQRARATKRTDTTEIVQGLRRIVKALHTYSQDVRNAYGLTGPQLWALKTLRHTGRRYACPWPMIAASIFDDGSRRVSGNATYRTPLATSQSR